MNYYVYWSAFCCWNDILDTCNLSEEGFTFMCGFRSPNLQLADSKEETAQQKGVEEESCSTHGCREQEKCQREWGLGSDTVTKVPPQDLLSPTRCNSPKPIQLQIHQGIYSHNPVTFAEVFYVVKLTVRIKWHILCKYSKMLII